jgi:hypothetical protein
MRTNTISRRPPPGAADRGKAGAMANPAHIRPLWRARSRTDGARAVRGAGAGRQYGPALRQGEAAIHDDGVRRLDRLELRRRPAKRASPVKDYSKNSASGRVQQLPRAGAEHTLRRRPRRKALVARLTESSPGLSQVEGGNAVPPPRQGGRSGARTVAGPPLRRTASSSKPRKVRSSASNSAAQPVTG